MKGSFGGMRGRNGFAESGKGPGLEQMQKPLGRGERAGALAGMLVTDTDAPPINEAPDSDRRFSCRAQRDVVAAIAEVPYTLPVN